MAPDPQSSATVDKGAKGLDEMTLQQKYEQLQERYAKLLEDKIEELSGRTETKTAPSRRDSTVTFAGNEAASSSVKTANIIDGNANNAKIQYRMDTYDEKGMPVQEPYDPAQFDKNMLKPGGTIAATFVYYFNRQKIQILTELKVESTEVRSILQRHLKHYPGYHWDIPQLSIFSPFEPLIHNWKALADAVTANPEDKGHDDLAAILEAVKASKDVKEYFESDYGGETGVKEVLFKYLWTIFPPGELVIMPTGFMKKHPQLFIVRNAHIVRTYDRKDAVNLSCWSYDWDGTRKNFSRACVDIRIDFFKGQRRITTLPCYPLKMYENGDIGEFEKLKLKLVKRGMLFHDLCTRPRGNQLFEYDGSAFLRGTGVRHIDPAVSSSNIDSDDDSGGHTLARSRSSMHDVPAKMISKSGRQMNIKGRVMVDFESYARHGPDEPIPMGDLKVWPFDGDDECGCEKCKEPGGPFENQRSRWDASEVISTAKLPKGEISDDECRQFITKLPEDEIQRFMICAPRVLGYHLMEKKWIEMFVDDVKEVDHRSSREAFEKVQLAGNHKTLIRELVQSHTNDKDVNKNTPRSKMNDLTKGKGEGLVILLHGPPGVGKTLTAESVAQVTRKPLFPMGVGDVTTDPVKVESRLEQLFELAEVWHAVMLFDEADVFLESRASSADVTRVGLVSVLLRILEYYQGILILTTNRIKSFDIAVQSRINLAVEFGDLKEKQIQAIFKNLLDQLEDKFIEDKRGILRWFNDDDEAGKWAERLNGRQIRNVVFSAASLAGSQEENILTLKEIKAMLKETYSFHNHLESVTLAAREKNEMYINRKAG